MKAIQYFDEHVRKNKICDDVFYDVILPMCRRDCCRDCNRWVGSYSKTRNTYFACYFETYTLCLYCRHNKLWPRR